jgi:hypothetical protein
MTDRSIWRSGKRSAPKASLPRRGRWSARFGEFEETMATNPDFRDLLSALSDEHAEYLLVGAHAVMLYTAPRYTKDLDIWIRPARRWQILPSKISPLPAPFFKLASSPIELMSSPPSKGSNRVMSSYGGIPIAVLSIDDLLQNKRALGRPQDLIDVERLEKACKG